MANRKRTLITRCFLCHTHFYRIATLLRRMLYARIEGCESNQWSISKPFSVSWKITLKMEGLFNKTMTTASSCVWNRMHPCNTHRPAIHIGTPRMWRQIVVSDHKKFEQNTRNTCIQDFRIVITFEKGIKSPESRRNEHGLLRTWIITNQDGIFQKSRVREDTSKLPKRSH